MFLRVCSPKSANSNCDLAPDVIVSRGRDADASGLGDALKARRDIDAVPEDIMGLYNHVTDIDADTEGNSLVCGIVNCKFPDTGLKLQSSSNRLRSEEHTSELQSW